MGVIAISISGAKWETFCSLYGHVLELQERSFVVAAYAIYGSHGSWSRNWLRPDTLWKVWPILEQLYVIQEKYYKGNIYSLNLKSSPPQMKGLIFKLKS